MEYKDITDKFIKEYSDYKSDVINFSEYIEVNPSSMTSTKRLIKLVKTALLKKIELSRMGKDFIFCIALSAYSV